MRATLNRLVDVVFEEDVTEASVANSQANLAGTSEYIDGYGRELRQWYDRLVRAAGDDTNFQQHQMPVYPVGVALKRVLDNDQFKRDGTPDFAAMHPQINTTAAIVAALRIPDGARGYADDAFGAAVFHDLGALHMAQGVDSTAVLIELAHRPVEPYKWRVRIAAHLDELVGAGLADREQINEALHDPLPGSEPFAGAM